VNDPVCGGKLVTIHACAAALYSDKAHRHWDSPKTTGVDRLRQRIFRALNAYERRLLHLDAGANQHLDLQRGGTCWQAPGSHLRL
jgi:hypothetical protein